MTSNQMIKHIPCLSHPLNVLFVDDSQGFLDSLTLELSGYGQMLVTTDPHQAQQILQHSEQSIISRIGEPISETEMDSYNEQFIDIEIGQIKDMIYDQDRFDYVPIVVVDYQMPHMNGVEFCRQLQDNKSIYKIMLTAEADKDTAIQAFNEGIIDHFLMKQSETLYQDLVTAIDQQKEHYFNALSKPILDSPIAPQLKTVLCNPNYIELFNQILQQSQAVEYYLLDTSGSFLMLDDEANPYWLMIRTQADFDSQVSMLAGLEKSSTIQRALETRQRLLFLLTESEFQQSADNWEQYLFQAYQLDDELWYATAQGPIKQVIDWQSVQAFKAHSK